MPPNKPSDEFVHIVKELYSKTDESVKELTKKIDTFRDEHRDRLDRLKEDTARDTAVLKKEFDLKFEKTTIDLTTLQTESKSYTRNWGTVIGIVSSIITALIVFLLTKGLK